MAQRPTRFYRVQRAGVLSAASIWLELAIGYENVLGWNNVAFSDSSTDAFYWIRAG